MAFLGTGLLSGKKNTGSSIGGNLIESLSEGLQGLAHKKMQQRQDSENAKFWTSQGVDHQTAQALSRQPESIQKAFFERWEAPAQPSQQQVQNQQYQQPEQMQSSYTPEQANILKSIANPQERQRAAQHMQQLANAAPSSIQNQTANEQFGKAAVQQQIADKIAQGGLKPANYKAQEKLQQDKSLADYKQQRKEEFELAKYERQKVDKDIDQSKEWLKETNKKARGVKETNVRLDRMEKLLDSGKLDNPLFASGLDTLSNGILGYGINLKSLQTPESQEFEKLSNDMLKGIQDIFGSRILKTEVDNFLKTIPTLSQSDAGKKAVIDNLKLLNEATITQDKIAKEIVKQNDGHIPPNLEVMVDEKLDPYLDELHQRFVNQTHAVSEGHKSSPIIDAYRNIFWK